MKLKVLSLLSVLTFHQVLASEFECGDIDDENVLISLKMGMWEYVPADSIPEVTEAPVPVETEYFSFQKLVMSYSFDHFFKPVTASPMKKSSSAPLLEYPDLNINDLASKLNCQPAQLAEIDVENLKAISACVSQSRLAILEQLTNLGDIALFELFFIENAASIISSINTASEFNEVIICCIKMNSMVSFFNIMINPKFPLNGPRAVVSASAYGSVDILKFVLEEKNSVDFDWTWKHIDGSDGYMFEFGTDPLSAALFLGAHKAIIHGHRNCLSILIEANVQLDAKKFFLLKEAATQNNLDIFVDIYNRLPNISLQTMNEVVIITLKNNTEALFNYILTLNYALSFQANLHLDLAFSTKNPSLVKTLTALIPSLQINILVLNRAFASESDEIFVTVAKAANAGVALDTMLMYILNERYHHHAMLIKSNVALTSEIISRALANSVHVNSVDFIRKFLSEPKCTVIAVKPGFLAALDSNSAALIDPFYEKFQSNDLLILRIKPITNLIERLFEKNAWISIKILVQKYFNAPEFPRHLFMAMIMETEQAEIASIAMSLGGIFPQGKIADVKNSEILSMALSQTAPSSLVKGQSKRK